MRMRSSGCILNPRGFHDRASGVTAQMLRGAEIHAPSADQVGQPGFEFAQCDETRLPPLPFEKPHKTGFCPAHFVSPTTYAAGKRAVGDHASDATLCAVTCLISRNCPVKKEITHDIR